MIKILLNLKEVDQENLLIISLDKTLFTSLVKLIFNHHKIHKILLVLKIYLVKNIK
jgi:hypothetical protein